MSVRCGNRNHSKTIKVHHHATVADIRNCFTKFHASTEELAENEQMNRDWAAMKNEAAQLEADQERAAYDRKEAARAASDPAWMLELEMELTR